jgi:hypothetical protein
MVQYAYTKTIINRTIPHRSQLMRIINGERSPLTPIPLSTESDRSLANVDPVVHYIGLISETLDTLPTEATDLKNLDELTIELPDVEVELTIYRLVNIVQPSTPRFALDSCVMKRGLL